MINLKKIYQQTEIRYKKRNIDIDSKEIKIFINNLYQQAKQNYSELSTPKLCSHKAYISLWLNQEIGNNIAQKSVKPISLKNPPKNFKEIAKFYKSYPPQLSLKQKSNQKQIGDLNDKKQKWLSVVKERNQFAIDQGYNSRLDMYFNDFKITQSEYKKFLKNVDKVISFCKKQIYANWGLKPNQNLDNYCLVCNSNIFPFKNLDGFLVFLKRKNKFYRENEKKIQIEFTNESRTEYVKKNDIFKITINKNTHLNHQIIELIHEVGHVETMAKIFKQDKLVQPKAYFLEKLAIEREIKFLNKYFPQALIARQGSVLRMIYQTLFEIEVYQNPKNDPNIIYLKYLKKCSKNTNKSDTWYYLSNQDILYKCFTQLIYTIAYTNVLIKRV